MTDDSQISYTTKEVLARIEGKLDVLATQLQSKADAASVEANKARISALEKEVGGHSMLVPEFLDVKQKLYNIERDPLWLRLHTTNGASPFERLERLERTAVSESAVKKYRNWLIAVAIPAGVGAAWAAIRIWELIRTGGLS